MITENMIDAAMAALAPDLFGRDQIRSALIAAERAAWIEPTWEDGEWLCCYSDLEWTHGNMVWGPWKVTHVAHERVAPSKDTRRRRVRRLPELPE